MRKRRIRTQNNPGQNLDSFLDILTNTVGVLMFIGLFVSLLAVEAGTVIRTPLQSKTEKEGKFFEVRNNQIFYISDPQIESRINQFISTLPECKAPDISEEIPFYSYEEKLQEIVIFKQCMDDRQRQLESFYYDNDDYQISFTKRGSVVYQSKVSAVGENSKQLMEKTSKFSTILQEQLDPNVNYIAFLVRPDSFEAFRKAREKAWSLGYEVGWEPMTDDRVLVFGSEGRSVGVQ